MGTGTGLAVGYYLGSGGVGNAARGLGGVVTVLGVLFLFIAIIIGIPMLIHWFIKGFIQEYKDYKKEKKEEQDRRDYQKLKIKRELKQYFEDNKK